MLERWAKDLWRYSPYQYHEDLLVWKGREWRCLRGGERAPPLYLTLVVRPPGL